MTDWRERFYDKCRFIQGTNQYATPRQVRQGIVYQTTKAMIEAVRDGSEINRWGPVVTEIMNNAEMRHFIEEKTKEICARDWRTSGNLPLDEYPTPPGQEPRLPRYATK